MKYTPQNHTNSDIVKEVGRKGDSVLYITVLRKQCFVFGVNMAKGKASTC